MLIEKRNNQINRLKSEFIYENKLKTSRLTSLIISYERDGNLEGISDCLQTVRTVHDKRTNWIASELNPKMLSDYQSSLTKYQQDLRAISTLMTTRINKLVKECEEDISKEGKESIKAIRSAELPNYLDIFRQGLLIQKKPNVDTSNLGNLLSSLNSFWTVSKLMSASSPILTTAVIGYKVMSADYKSEVASSQDETEQSVLPSSSPFVEQASEDMYNAWLDELSSNITETYEDNDSRRELLKALPNLIESAIINEQDNISLKFSEGTGEIAP